MKLSEPTFDVGGELWPALSADPGADIRALEHKIAKQSTELNLRVIEIVELYNAQQQQANELKNAYDEIDRLNRVVVTLHVTTTQHKADVVAAQDKIVISENEKLTLQAERDEALQEFKRASRPFAWVRGRIQHQADKCRLSAGAGEIPEFGSRVCLGRTVQIGGSGPR